MDLKEFIKDENHFPKPGIVFKDITPLLASPVAFNTAIDHLSIAIESMDTELVAGIEARGFILAGAVASLNTMGLVPVRKAGKLPPPFVKAVAEKEYGIDVLNVKPNEGIAKNIVIIDDVLATGGTLKATEELLTKAGYNVVGAIVLIDLKDLHGEILIGGEKVVSLLQY